MALVLFSWTDADNRPFTMALDCSVNETHTASSQVTEHQVEVGANVADHIRPMPQRLTIEGLITNTPISTEALVKSGMNISVQTEKHTVYSGAPFLTGIPTPPSTFSTLTFDDEFDRVRDGHERLLDAILHGRIVDIATSLRDYSNMAATMLSVPRNVETGGVLRFTIEFQELRFATTETVAVPVARKRDSRGSKPPTEPSAEEKAAAAAASESTLHAAAF